MWIFRSRLRPVPERFRPFWKEAKALNGADWKRKVFGAGGHRYRSYPVSEAAMQKFETWCGVTMPPAYREYMLNIGSGMGPYYGLWRPARIRAELEMLLKDGEWQQKPSPSRPFPYSLADAQAILARKAAGNKEPWASSTWPVDGCIPLCHQGCMYYAALVVAGECAGRVWDVAEDGGIDGLWIPGHGPKDSMAPPTFEEWLMGWIESARHALAWKPPPRKAIVPS